MSKSDFKFGKVTCANLHEVVDLIRELKSRDEGKLFLFSFCKHFKETYRLSGETALSKFLQKSYQEESVRLHELLELPRWEEPSCEALSTRKSVGGKMGRKRR